MDFNINDFVDRLRLRMYYRFPIETNIVNYSKHRNRPRHIRDVAFKDNPTEYVSENIRVFDIGNEMSEKNYPYYHILEEAPVIRKIYKGTDKTKGSQRLVAPSQRDYEIVNFNGKTFTKEYRKNIRGARDNIVKNATQWENGRKINASSINYKNIHYHYIENMLLAIAPIIADEFNMIYKGNMSSGLKEEYVMDNYDLHDNIDYESVRDYVSKLIQL